jgi:hypothetical protein
MQKTRGFGHFTSRGFILVVLGVIALAVAAILWTTGFIEGTGSNPTPHRIILFSEPGGPAPAMSDEAATQAGFVVVHSTSSLMDDVDGSTRAIIVTAAQLGQLDKGWIHGQYAVGMVVGSINVSAADWANVVGGTAPGPPFAEWPEPYVSIASGVDCPGGTGGSRGIGSSPVDDAMHLMTLIETYISFNDLACSHPGGPAPSALPTHMVGG